MKNKRFAPITRTGAVLLASLVIGGLFLTAFATPSMHLLDFRFNIYVALSAVTVAINLGLFFYFISKTSRTDERIWLAIYIGLVVIYSGAELMQRLSGNPHAALFWYYAETPIVAVAPTIFLFTLAYTNPSERRFPGVTAVLIICSLYLAFFYGFTNLVFLADPKLGVLTPWGYDFLKAIGPAIVAALLWYDFFLVLAISRLISFRRHTRNAILRKQSLLFIFAICIPLLGGTVSNIILPILNIHIMTLGALLATPAAALLIYGVVKYQLLNINPALFSHTILNIVQEAVVVTDAQLRIAYVNPKAEAMLGVKPEASESTSLLKVLQRDSAESLDKELHGVMSGNATTADIDHVDLKPIHATPTPVRITASHLALSDLDLWVWAMADITKELQTRSVIEHEVQVRTKELQEARAYLLSSINSLEQGFVLLNAKLGVEVMNRRAQALFNIKLEDAMHASPAPLSPRSAWNVDLGKSIENVVTSKRFKNVEAETTDGSFYQIFISPVLLQDHIIGVAVIIQDITEQRILDRSKDEFFSIASHELRTPLTAIRGNMAMVKDYFPEALKDKGLADMVSDTHDASVRLIAIVNDFLDSSRLEQGKMQFDLRPVSLEPLVKAVEKDLGLLLGRQKDEIVVTGFAKLPQAMADEGRVRQIIYNLVSNAIKYSENAKITISGEANDHEINISVTDTGKGISPENQKLLFRKFQQAGDLLTRDDTKGTGLGLYISKLLAKNMHGDVELKSSEVGKGSTFVLTLPRAKAK